MKTFITRTISGAVFAAIMIAGISLNWLLFLFLHLIIANGCLREFKKMFETKYEYPKREVSMRTLAFTGSWLIMATGSYFFLNRPEIIYLMLAIIPLLFIQQLFSYSQNAMMDLAFNLAALVYVCVPIMCIIMLAGSGPFELKGAWFPVHGGIILGIMLLIWTNDSLAYITGSLIGKHKLFPSISPGKTWEGFAGGVLFTLLVGFLLSKWLINYSMFEWMVIAVIVSVFGTVGDLIESMMKRNAGVKDSGNIMPGHGGFLDRFDAYLFVMPFILAFLEIEKSVPH